MKPPFQRYEAPGPAPGPAAAEPAGGLWAGSGPRVGGARAEHERLGRAQNHVWVAQDWVWVGPSCVVGPWWGRSLTELAVCGRGLCLPRVLGPKSPSFLQHPWQPGPPTQGQGRLGHAAGFLPKPPAPKEPFPSLLGAVLLSFGHPPLRPASLP